MNVILIKELTANGNIVVHQIHKTWETARATMRQSWCNCRGLTVEFKLNGTVGGCPEEFCTISYDEAPDVRKSLHFGLTEMPLFDCVDHL